VSKTNAFETALLGLIFLNNNIANIGDATGLRGSSAPGVFYVSAHSSDPGESGDQTSNEISYTGYARISIVRTSSGWSVSGNQATTLLELLFGLCTSGSGNITHIGIGTASSGTGFMLYKGPTSATLAFSPGINPKLPIGDLDITED
jgi:hypothetical protein